MIIWGRPLNVDLQTALADLRNEALLKNNETYLNHTTNSVNDIFVTCPKYENHGGAERTPSCSVSKEEGLVHCFGCGFSTSFPGLVAEVLHLSTPVEGFIWLIRKYSMPAPGERKSLGVGGERKTQKYFVSEELLDIYSYNHPYMYNRGLTQDVIDWFDIGFDPQSNSVTFPMRDVLERIVFIKKRPINRTKFHKYDIDEGVEKRELVYGLFLVKRCISRVKMVFLCEGEFDTLSFYCAEKYGLGIQGSDLFDQQIRQIVRVIGRTPICLAFDNDKAGRACKSAAEKKLLGKAPLYEIIYPNELAEDGRPRYKDPNDLLKAGLLKDVEIRPITL